MIPWPPTSSDMGRRVSLIFGNGTVETGSLELEDMDMGEHGDVLCWVVELSGGRVVILGDGEDVTYMD